MKIYIFSIVIIIFTCITPDVNAQRIELFGTVSNSNNEYLEGATIEVNGDGGTTTDSLGRYSFELDMTEYSSNNKLSLSFRYLGYETLDTILLSQGDAIYFNAVLHPALNQLDDIEITATSDFEFLETDQIITDIVATNSGIAVVSNNKRGAVFEAYAHNSNRLERRQLDRKFNYFHTSYRGDVHLVGEDYCWQKDPINNGDKYYARIQFDGLLKKCILVYDGIYLFKEFSVFNKKVSYYTYPEPNKPKAFLTLFNKAAAQSAKASYREILSEYYRTVKNLGENNIATGFEQDNIVARGEWSGDMSELMISNGLHQLISLHLNLEEKPFNVYEFTLKDELLVFDLENYELIVFNAGLKPSRKIGLEDKAIWQNAQILQDRNTKLLYVLSADKQLFSFRLNNDRLDVKPVMQIQNKDGLISKTIIADGNLYYLLKNLHNPLANIVKVNL